MKVLDVMWFSGVAAIGIVRVETDYDGIKYYIGAPIETTTEQQDAQYIADWGLTFPLDAGDVLFGINKE